MKTTTLKMSITDTPYTIDTYSTFDLDSADEFIMENIKEDHPELTDISYDDIDWTYDNKGYVQALADNWLKLMKEHIKDAIILDITSDGPAYSPREYNFTTDSAPVSFTIDQEALEAYIALHKEAYEREKHRSYDGYMWLGDELDNMFLFYIEKESTQAYTIDHYLTDQYEQVDAYEFAEGVLKLRSDVSRNTCTPGHPDLIDTICKSCGFVA